MGPATHSYHSGQQVPWPPTGETGGHGQDWGEFTDPSVQLECEGNDVTMEATNDLVDSLEA